VNIAQDLSPGTASGLNDLVPEARLSPALQTQLAGLSCWLSHSFFPTVRTLQRVAPEMRVVFSCAWAYVASISTRSKSGRGSCRCEFSIRRRQ
jgi:hypothetical protein